METGKSGKLSAWFALWVLVLAVLFSFVDRQVLALLTAPVAVSLHLRDGQIGLIQGLGSAVFAMIATYPLGWLSDRFDRRWVLSGSVLVWAAGTAGCGLAGGFAGLFVAVLAISAGEAGLPSLVYSAIPDLFEGRSRVTANQIFYVAQILSSAAGIALGGAASAALDHLQSSLPIALQHFEHWRIIFFIVAAPTPILIGLIALTRLGRRHVVQVHSRSAADDEADLIPYLRVHGGAAALVIAALCAYGLPFGSLLIWTPTALTRLFGVKPAENGLGLGLALAAACIVGVGLAGWLMRRFVVSLGGRAPLRISCYTLVGSLPLAVLVMFVQSPWQAFVLVSLLMSSGTLIGSLLPSIIQNLSPPKLRGRMVAIYGVSSVITSGIGVTLVGTISDAMKSNTRGLLIALTMLFAVFWGIGAILMKLSERPFQNVLDRISNTDQSV